MNKNQKGFEPVLIIVIIVAVAAIGLVAWRILSSGNNTVSINKNSSDTSNPFVSWAWNGNKWQADGAAPACDSPVKFSTAPANLSKATAILYPGQFRGGNYKPHGGFRFDGSKNTDIYVKAIMDGYITSGSRYIEAGETQYMFTIVNNCGIAYRYDHLATLSETTKALANLLPPAKVDDSRTTDFEKPVQVKAGDVIATSVGFQKSNNVSFDLGVYDYRQTNNAAADPNFVKTHKNELPQAAYALCWLNMFSSSDSSRIQNLPAADAISGKTSDYCK